MLWSYTAAYRHDVARKEKKQRIATETHAYASKEQFSYLVNDEQGRCANHGIVKMDRRWYSISTSIVEDVVETLSRVVSFSVCAPVFFCVFVWNVCVRVLDTKRRQGIKRLGCRSAPWLHAATVIVGPAVVVSATIDSPRYRKCAHDGCARAVACPSRTARYRSTYKPLAYAPSTSPTILTRRIWSTLCSVFLCAVGCVVAPYRRSACRWTCSRSPRCWSRTRNAPSSRSPMLKC